MIGEYPIRQSKLCLEIHIVSSAFPRNKSVTKPLRLFEASAGGDLLFPSGGFQTANHIRGERILTEDFPRCLE